MKRKTAILMCIPLVIFGLSFRAISRIDSSEKIEHVQVDPVDASQDDIRKEKVTDFIRKIYVLPISKYLEPIKKEEAENIYIDAKSVLAIDENSGAILYEKNSEQRVKIASLTKLATAGTIMGLIETENSNPLIKVGNYNLDRIIEVSKKAVEADGDSGMLIVGEKLTAGDLLRIMLIASSNDAAWALAEDVSKKESKKENGIKYFVDSMNEYAKKEGLNDSYFTNPHGIDEADNYSSAKDIVRLAKIILKDYPEVFSITANGKADIKSVDGKFEHSIKSTNKLLGVLPGIVGGKTGYTDQAGESLLLVVEDSSGQHRIIAVIIDANGRFSEMQKLVNWIWSAYDWK